MKEEIEKPEFTLVPLSELGNIPDSIIEYYSDVYGFYRKNSTRKAQKYLKIYKYNQEGILQYKVMFTDDIPEKTYKEAVRLFIPFQNFLKSKGYM